MTIVLAQCAAIFSVSLLIAVTLTLLEGKRMEREYLAKGQAAAAHLATKSVAIFEGGQLDEMRQEVDDWFGRDGVVAIQITDKDNGDLFMMPYDGYIRPQRFHLPAIVDPNAESTTLNITESETQWRFSAPIIRATVWEDGQVAEKRLLGVANVMISKNVFANARSAAFVENLFAAAFLALCATVALGWFVILRGRALRLLTNLISGRTAQVVDMTESRYGTVDVLDAIRDYQRTIVMAGDRERTLRQARDEAFEAALAKAQFVANISHEVRTPINGMVGMLEILKRSDLSKEQRDYVETAWNSAEALMRLLNTVLDFSSLEAGKAKITLSEFDVHQFLHEVMRIFTKQASLKHLALECDIADGVPHKIVADPVRLRQILTNLLDNSVKFTDQGKIVLHVHNDPVGKGKRLYFAISDTGIGVAEDMQDKLFDGYARDARHGRLGTGLGLAITKNLVSMVGGSIGVKSKEGGGTEFWFTMAFSLRSSVEEDPVAVGPQMPNAPATTIASATATATVPALPAGASLRGMRVLVVDDNRTNLSVAKQMLCLLGCEVQCCSDGEEAVNEFRRRRYAIVLMDCNMPTMNGFDATKRIREIEEAEPFRGRVTVIAASADNSTKNEERCLNAGMDRLLAKPITLEKLQLLLTGAHDSSIHAVAAKDGLQAAVAEEAPMLDLGVMDQLRQILGTGFSRTIAAYVEDVPLYLERLKDAIASNDQTRAVEAAHSLRGSSGQVGAIRFHALAKSAEGLAQQDRLAEVAKLVVALESTFASLAPMIEAEIDHPRNAISAANSADRSRTG